MRTRRWWVLVVLCLSLLVTGIDQTILNVALPTLVRDLHASTSQLQWIVDAYAVIFAGLLLTAGNLGDRFGARRLLVAGLAVFGAGSAACAFSGSSPALIAARALMGVGGAMLMPATLSIITNVFQEPHERARAVGIWAGTSGLGVAIGPVVGGWLLDHYWWGSVFLVNVPVVAIALAGSLWIVPRMAGRRDSRPDILGTLLSIGGLGTLLWGIIEAPIHGWGATSTLGALGAGALLLAGFVVWELRCDHPMLDVRLFTHRAFAGASASLALALFALSGALFMLTQYLQFVLGNSALRTGLLIAPVSIVMFVAAAAAGLLVRRLGARFLVTGGLAVVAAGLLATSALGLGDAYSQVIWRFLLLGAGIGLVMPPATDAVLGSLPVERAGVGSATNSTMIQVGGALGVGVLGSLLATRYAGRVSAVIAGHHVPPAARQAIVSSLGGALMVADRAGGTLGAALAHVADAAFVSGMSLAMIVGAATAIAGALVALVVLPPRNKAQARLLDLHAGKTAQAGEVGKAGEVGRAGEVRHPGEAGAEAAGSGVGAPGAAGAVRYPGEAGSDAAGSGVGAPGATVSGR